MPEVKIVGRGVDTLVLNVRYADTSFQPVKRELAEELQEELSTLQNEARETEAPVVTRWAFRGFALWMQPKGSRGPWRWILRCPLLSIAISRGRLNSIIAQVRLSSEFLWSCETAASAMASVEDFLCVLFDSYLWLQVSAVDLCADVIGWDVACCNWQDITFTEGFGVLEVRRALVRLPTQMGKERGDLYVEAEPKTKSSRRRLYCQASLLNRSRLTVCARTRGYGET